LAWEIENVLTVQWDTPLPEEQKRVSMKVPPVPPANSGCDRPWDIGGRSLDVAVVLITMLMLITMILQKRMRMRMLMLITKSMILQKRMLRKGACAARARRDVPSERARGFRPAAQQLSLLMLMLHWNCRQLIPERLS
jgi:hypothetical protein